MDGEKRGRGRPPKATVERRRHNQTFRCNDSLREALEKSAEANQRSMSEEVEYRLQMDLAADEDRKEKLRDPNHGVTSELLSRIQQGMSLLRGYVGDDWPDDTAANTAMYYVIVAIADDYLNSKPEKDWSKLERDTIERTLKAADKVVDVVTWRDRVQGVNKLLDAASGSSRMSAQEFFAVRKKLAARLEALESARRDFE